jgi:hypothetical protein
METQRVNVYIAGSGIPVFYVEQYNSTLRDWFTVGDTYEKIEHAESTVNHHNLTLVMNELLKSQETK